MLRGIVSFAPTARLANRRLLAFPSSASASRSTPTGVRNTLLTRLQSTKSSNTRIFRRQATLKQPQRKNKSTLAVPAGKQQQQTALTKTQIRSVFLSAAIPMIGFGFMDNFVMITAGSAIDNSLGLHLGLATMTAAAIGQIFSDVAGVAFGDTMGRAFRVSPAQLTAAQQSSLLVGRLKLAGGILGVVVGCTLGASALWVVPDRENTAAPVASDPSPLSNASSPERIRDQLSRVQEVLKDVMTQDEHWSKHRASCTLYVNESMGKCIPKSPRHIFGGDTNKSVASIDRLLRESHNSAAVQAAKEARVVVFTNTIYVPVMTDNGDIKKVLGILKIDLESGSFYSGSEIHDAKRVAQNLGFFLNRMM